ncbi:ABC transporter permease subunit, partial [Pseudomonas syringae]|uniref:ABC transporter permease subunit n=1 Tax=Pseudomonas syringae TaxID=317 RepID=UPI004032EAD8
MADIDLSTFLLALLAGSIRVGTPFLFVSLGECLAAESGRISLGLDGILVAGAMSWFAAACLTGSAWLGVGAAAGVGLVLGLLHGIACSLPRVNDIAFGIALILLGTGLAFFLGKAFIQPQAPMLPSLALGTWSDEERLRSALNINVLFFIGVALAFALH